MPTSDPIDILLAHDRWATRQILDACAPLESEIFHQRFEMGPGSLHDTITHMLAALRGWADLLAGREFTPRIDGDGTHRTTGELTALHDQIASDFAHHAKAHPLDETVTRERGGKAYTFSRGAVITHITTHGMHHRAQCLNMLRHVGLDPQPASSVMQWTMMADPLR
jgi:uncharacterized damage-inducible protein DinB